MKKIKIIIKRPGLKAYTTQIDNTLEAMQAAVGGCIETVTLSPDLVVVCNEEGRINGMPFNCRWAGIRFYGTFFLCGVNGEDFWSIPEGFTLKEFNGAKEK